MSEPEGRISLEGRVAIVTGAGGGLGRSHALALARRGAAVVVNDIGGSVDGRNRSDAAERVAVEIRDAGGRAVSNTGSVASQADAQVITDTALEHFGRIDIAVSNAGIIRNGPYTAYTEADFRDILGVHLFGSFFVTQAAYRPMKEQGYGRVVFTTSGSALYGQPDSPGYCAAKMGVVGLMNSLAVEGRDHGVLANAIAPIAYTRMTAEAFGPAMEQRTRPELVSELVAYLASEQSTVTQRIIEVGAGTYARVFLGRAEGVSLDPATDIDAEKIGEHMNAILATSRFETPDDVMQMLAGVLDVPFEYGGAHLSDV